MVIASTESLSWPDSIALTGFAIALAIIVWVVFRYDRSSR